MPKTIIAENTDINNTVAVIYARFSSDMQREESIDAQVRACREHAHKRGYVVAKVYKDEAKSGKTLIGRDGYNQMLADAAAHKFDVIIFHKIDRNARNELNYYLFKNKLSKLGISYEYAVQNIDNSPEGQMMENVLVGFAAYYSRNLAKEVKKGLNENAYKAQFNGGVPPLGYKVINNHYVVDERESEAVRTIFDMYVAGEGYGSIALALNAAGYRTREGKPFAKNSLYEILRNEKYIGVYTFNRTHRAEGRGRNMHAAVPEDLIRIEDAIPAIISKEDFYLAAKRRERQKNKPGIHRAKESYILSGKIFCGKCGSPLCGHRVTTRAKHYIYYSCAKKERVKASCCKQGQIPRDLVEDFVLDAIENRVLTEANISTIAETIIEEYNKIVAEYDDRNALLTAKTAAERKLNNLYTVIESSDGEIDDFDILRLKKIKQEIKDINAKLDKYISAPPPKINIEDILEGLRTIKNVHIKNLSAKNKKALADIFVDKVIVTDKFVQLRLSIKNIFPNVFYNDGAEGLKQALCKLYWDFEKDLAS